ncbi:hypothetical protein BJV78DRAFT_64967 [Lactifluus subvellereus]|nr:hypothetical protein BJV78DRAFT_64967 [Lactifluus subvellereus]
MQGLTTLPPQLPRPSHPPVPVLLNASNLELLVISDEKNRVQDFVASQARYARAHANEGRAVRASWDISTPEKEKMKLHKHQPSAGFETPVLKPRAVQIQPEPDHEPRSSPPRHKSLVNKPSAHSPRVAKRGKATPDFTEAVPPEKQKRPKNKSTDKRPRSPKAARKERRARSDTDEEHLASMSSLPLPAFPKKVHRSLQM